MPFRVISEAQGRLGQLQDEMNRLVERFWHAGVATPPLDGQRWAPLLDMIELRDRYILYAEAPGIDPDKIEVSATGASLSLRGEKPRPPEMNEADGALRTERRFGSFCRTVELPSDADPEGVSARCRLGVVEIEVKKLPAAAPKFIRVEAGD